MDEKSSELLKYDDLVNRFEAAYAAHERMYQARQPKPERGLAKRDSVVVPLALIALIIASVIVSGSRTIVEFGGGLVGASAFIMIEVGIVAYAFFRTRRSTDTDKKRLEDVQRLAGRGLKLVVVVAVGANVHAVLKEQGIGLDNNINTVIQVLVAISAPVLALISGDVLALEMVVNGARQRRLDDEYEAVLRTWRDGLNTSWNSQKARLGIRVEMVSEADGRSDTGMALPSAVRPQDTDTDGHGHATGQGYTKRTDARALVWTYLETTPGADALKVRELADATGASKTTAAEVLKEFRQAKRGDLS